MSSLRQSQARHLVGEAVYVWRLSEPDVLSSSALERIARSLAPGDPQQPSPGSWVSADGLWRLDPTDSGFSFRTSGYQSLWKQPDWLRDLAEHAASAGALRQFESVHLYYRSAVSVDPRKIEGLLADRVILLIDLNYDRMLEQALSGTWERGLYQLHYGLQPREDKTLYLSTAFVTAEQVEGEELSEVLGDLDERGLRLLSWPIAPRAIESLQPLQPDPSYWISDLPWELLSKQSLDEDPATERAQLLARKYGGDGLSADDEARLEDLTERVRILFPQVTEKDWRRLEAIESRLDEIENRTDQIQSKYRLVG